MNDTFADIAALGVIHRGKDLFMPLPPVPEDKYLKADAINSRAVFTPSTRMNTKEQLLEELERQRKRYAPFMENHAPELGSHRISDRLEYFDWRVETDEDKKDFIGIYLEKGQWERVRIPHYGGPLGKAATYYRAEFDLLGKHFEPGRLFICFKGVDYRVHVFLNGCYLGSHEGFFAPFEFDFSHCAVPGKNTLVVKVENDFICMGNEAEWTDGRRLAGDKIYAATGMGYDDPEFGWHHCPPGMGICQEVSVEARPGMYISDVFARPLPDLESVEVWIEASNADVEPEDMAFEFSLYGKNFSAVIFEDIEYKPACDMEDGFYDSYTVSKLKDKVKKPEAIPLKLEKGRNRFVTSFRIPGAKIWEPDNPWLYEIHIRLKQEGREIDTFRRQFGMRTFEMDTGNEPKGTFFLNGRKIRLRGANTMGHEQQCVAKSDREQLRDDILLAKICNMNFLRLTQRPVQPEVYEYCDMLGLMTQTDLPLFAVLSRSQFCEAVRQAEEMERLVRQHPCNIMVTYINEPMPNAFNKPHRNLLRAELEEFFKAADIVVRLNNPDRVIKHIDGDYDPPVGCLPDNHCYPAWYNGHGIDIGMLNKGYWQYIKPGWNYGCGEFGAEGLDPLEVMWKYYPEEWLPQSADEEKDWSPGSIRYAQTGKFHYFFYDTQETLEGWVRESQKHQAWAARFMTEAFRRDSRMISFAIHLFIDAFPSGWMKAIMDVDRNPKPAYFAYRDALQPLLANIRSDRFRFFAGEDVQVEAWICNDRVDIPENMTLNYYVEAVEEILSAGSESATVPSCGSAFQGFIRFKAHETGQRSLIKVRMGLLDRRGEVLNDAVLEIEVFPRIETPPAKRICILGKPGGKGDKLIREAGGVAIGFEEAVPGDIIVVDGDSDFSRFEAQLANLAEQGSKVIFLELLPGEYRIASGSVQVKECSMLPLHFASRNTGHPMVRGFHADDFRLWYDPGLDRIAPLLESTFVAEGYAPILTAANTNERNEWGSAFAAAEKSFGKGKIIISQLKLSGRISTNPPAAIFAERLLAQGNSYGEW